MNMTKKINSTKYFRIIIATTLLMVEAKVQGDTFGGLYPRESETREVKTLDGIWNFRLAPVYDPNVGFRENWNEQPLKTTGDIIRIPVPSSYNDVTQSKALRDHVGWAWYDRQVYIPKHWVDDAQRIRLRFGSAHYNTIVYVNGVEVMSHEFGHLPFSADITSVVTVDRPNLITVSINNTLTHSTIPQGAFVYKTDTTKYPEGYFVMETDFDFFNYAGIHRPVYLYTTPRTYIEDVTIQTDIVQNTGVVTYNATVESDATAAAFSCTVEVYDAQDVLIDSRASCHGQITIDNPQLWWPFLMNDHPGYLYTLKVNVSDSLGRVDIYPQKFGIRTVGWNSTTVTINGSPVYLTGCGKHEDNDFIGKGVNYANIVKDFSLLKWLGANSFRTSHYPYAEEIMDMADEEGIMVIDESPAVNLKGFEDPLLEKHKEIMAAMYRRDKNRPSVIMWSVANEANTDESAADDHFKQVTDYVREIDGTRPITIALNKPLETDHAAQYMDVLLLNKYFSWYSDTGHLELIERQTISEVSRWFKTHKKPIGMSEYGAGTIPGLHMDPAFTWSEEYQAELLRENFKAFDVLRNEGYFFAEMIWNFADFATDQGTTRVGGNKKGIFTRSRQPKTAAHILRQRYQSLANMNTTSTNNIWEELFSF